MAKPEWGTKRQCPKCGERFYDLNKPLPLTCVACGTQFEPEVILKSKQPIPVEEAKPVRKAPAAKSEPDEDGDEDLEEDIEIDEEEEDDDLLSDDLDDDDVSDVIEKPRKSSGD